jgi:CheY-like chemotaxis protein
MKKILIVDDHPGVQDLLVATLRKAKYLVLKAWTGEQAVEIAGKERPDLILMDITMPGVIDGVEATRILKNDPKTSKCAIIMLTAKDRVEDRRSGLTAGADAYFSKPFSPLELLRKITEILA